MFHVKHLYGRYNMAPSASHQYTSVNHGEHHAPCTRAPRGGVPPHPLPEKSSDLLEICLWPWHIARHLPAKMAVSKPIALGYLHSWVPELHSGTICFRRVINHTPRAYYEPQQRIETRRAVRTTWGKAEALPQVRVFPKGIQKGKQSVLSTQEHKALLRGEGYA